MELEINNKKVNVIFSKEIKEQLAKKASLKARVINTINNNYTKLTANKEDEVAVVDHTEKHTIVFDTINYGETIIVKHVVPNSRVF